jgi:hypothetical protein
VGTPGAKPAPADSSPGGDLAAADEAVPGWTGLIDQLMKQYPRLGACLMNGLPRMEAGSERLTVCFTEDKKFQVDSIAGECGTIETVAAGLWNRAVKVDLVLGDCGQAAEVTEEIRQEVAPTHREELDKACAEDPSLGDLVDLMGGRPLPESAREAWRKGEQ